MERHGAKLGVGEGRTGNSYAIPTKDEYLRTLPLFEINEYVDKFLDYAVDNPDLEFDLVAIGCGLAGYKPKDIAPMFANAPKNVHKPKEFM